MDSNEREDAIRSATSSLVGSPKASRSLVVAEVVLIVLVYFLYAGWPPPGVNEAHYLAKAKHYWDPAWCAGDVFLDSNDTHLLFYWTFGLLTRWCSLASAAWIGRSVCWFALAIGWRSLSDAILPRPLVSVLTAALFLMLSAEGQMAGEWVVGGLEAKAPAYACVWLGLASLLRGRWSTCILCLGVAAAWHVLVGGWSCVALGVAWLLTPNRPALTRLLPSVLLCCVISLAGLIPAVAMNWETPAEVCREANQIQVYERLSHHLVFHRFPHERMLRHAALLAIWALLFRASPKQSAERSMHRFVAGVASITVTGVLVDQATLYVPDVAASLLRFYWFRLSDVFLPMGTAFGIAALWDRVRSTRPVFSDWGLVCLVIAVGSWLVGHYVRNMADLRAEADRGPAQSLPRDVLPLVRLEQRDWLNVCHWIRTNTKPGDLFITPRGKQTFKWYAERPEFANWKDMPQDAASVVEWWRRIRQVYHWSPVESWEARLQAAADQHGVRYILVDRRKAEAPLNYPRVYPTVLDANEHYIVYQVPREASEDTSK